MVILGSRIKIKKKQQSIEKVNKLLTFPMLFLSTQFPKKKKKHQKEKKNYPKRPRIQLVIQCVKPTANDNAIIIKAT